MPDVSLPVATMTFACAFGGVCAGMLVRARLPEHHRTKETEDVIKLAMGVVATMSALVIGLLVSSAKSSLDAKDAELKKIASDIILLERQLVHYGPDVHEARDLLRRYTAAAIDSTWPEEAARPPQGGDGRMLLEDLQTKLRALTPANEAQRWLQTRALQLSDQIAETRWLLRVQVGSAIPPPFLVILVCWLTILFTSFGLFAPRNPTALTALLLCSLAIAASVFVILEMTQPFAGLIRISSTPMREALQSIGG